MGYRDYDGDVHASVTSKTAFDYDKTAHDTGVFVVHPTLDPKGVTLRESRDSDDHPKSRAVAIVLDGTGSNRDQARVVHAQLPELMGQIVRKGYTADPQIMFMVVNDATDGDPIPSQASQFESDNRIDIHLGNALLLGGGGGGMEESYELAMYFLARHTAIDCMEKRGELGLVFMIGDEKAYPRVRADQVQRVFGDQLQGDIPIDEIVAELKEKYEVVFFVPRLSQHGRDPAIPAYWRRHFGEQNVHVVDDTSDIVPLIAGEVLAREGVDTDTIITDLGTAGASARALATLKDAFAKRPVGTSMAKVSGELDLAAAGADATGAERI